MLDETMTTNDEDSFDLDEMISQRKCINCLHASVIMPRIFCFYHPGRERQEVWPSNFCGSFSPTSETIIQKREGMAASITSKSDNNLSGHYE